MRSWLTSPGRLAVGAEHDRANAQAGAVEAADIGDDLARLAVAKGADGAVDRLEGEAVAHAAIALHVGRLEARAVRRRHMAVGAFELLAEAVAGAEPPRHLGDAADAVEVQRVREFEVAHLARPPVERDALHASAARRPSGSAPTGWNSGWSRSKSAASPKRVSRHARVEVGVAVRAESLRRRRDRLRSLMLGMAIDAAARIVAEGLLDGELDPPPGAELGVGARQPAVRRHDRRCGYGRRCRRRRGPARTRGRGRRCNCPRAPGGPRTGCRCSTTGRHGTPGHNRRGPAPARNRPRSARPGRARRWPPSGSRRSPACRA